MLPRPREGKASHLSLIVFYLPRRGKEKLMKARLLRSFFLAVGVATILATAATLASAQPTGNFHWDTVANKNDVMPNSVTPENPTGRTYNSFNQPSVNAKALVAFRARSRGGPPLGPPTRGIYTRDMAQGKIRKNTINTIAGGSTQQSRGATEVPDPNNTHYPPTDSLASFIEFPSIPRTGIQSNAVATRGNHQPVWTYIPEGETENARAGTSGIYVNFDGNDSRHELFTGASRLGAVPEFSSLFAVPLLAPPTAFDVFPGAPAITDDGSIAFKGNYTEGGAKTGVFYRHLTDAVAGGLSPIKLIANSDTTIPNRSQCSSSSRDTFGSTAPPSAAQDKKGIDQMVFVGLDNEDSPQCGGIYQSALTQPANLITLVAIESKVPGIANATFNRLGEGLSYDGRFVGFWGAWGTQTKTVRLYCPAEGNADRIAFCNNIGIFAPDPETGERNGDLNSICNDNSDDTDRCYQEKEVPLHQGIFVYDTETQRTHLVARTGASYDDFVYWVYSGRVPGTGEGGEDEGDEDGEPARWRSSAFVAVSGRGAAVWTAFKARTGDLDPDTHVYENPIDGIYLGKKPGVLPLMTVVDTTMPGTVLDPEAPAASTIFALGMERDSFRGRWLVINASMGEEVSEEDAGMAGIYLTNVP